jgi:ribosomal protein L28
VSKDQEIHRRAFLVAWFGGRWSPKRKRATRVRISAAAYKREAAERQGDGICAAENYVSKNNNLILWYFKTTQKIGESRWFPR